MEQHNYGALSMLMLHIQQSGITNCNYIHSPLIICHQDPIITNIGDDKNNYRCVDLKYMGSQKCICALIKDIHNYLF